MRRRFLEVYFPVYVDTAPNAVLALTQLPVLRFMRMLPVGQTCELRSGVTVLGDVTHVITPFAGVGVNVGMMDTPELGEGIAAFVEEAGKKKKPLG